MGSYRQSPVCHHCWETGHTKNHCPEIKQAAANGEQWAKNLIENKNNQLRIASVLIAQGGDTTSGAVSVGNQTRLSTIG